MQLLNNAYNDHFLSQYNIVYFHLFEKSDTLEFTNGISLCEWDRLNMKFNQIKKETRIIKWKNISMREVCVITKWKYDWVKDKEFLRLHLQRLGINTDYVKNWPTYCPQYMKIKIQSIKIPTIKFSLYLVGIHDPLECSILGCDVPKPQQRLKVS